MEQTIQKQKHCLTNTAITLTPESVFRIYINILGLLQIYGSSPKLPQIHQAFVSV